MMAQVTEGGEKLGKAHPTRLVAVEPDAALAVLRAPSLYSPRQGGGGP